MKTIAAVILSATYGLLIRFVFGFFNEAFEIMSIAFLFLLPFLLGFLTIIFIPLKDVRNATRAFFLPWLTSLLLLIITIACSIEGAICWIMVYPFFSVVCGLGGVIAYEVKLRRENKTNRNTGFNLSVLAMLPLFLGYVERDASSSTTSYQLTKAVVINAPAATVWHNLTHIGAIRQNENRSYLIDVVGFPRHTSTFIDTLAVGGNRKALFEKGLFFDETITAYKPMQLLSVSIKTDPDKIPANVLDEHIVIGGRHINILQDTYKLQALPNNQCRLRLTSSFSICTPFNWYAKLWANLVINNILQGELDLIKSRTDEVQVAKI